MTMPRNLPAGLTNTLLWSEDLGYGWHSGPCINYDAGYFEHYRKLDSQPMAAALTRARLELVGKYIEPNDTLDIGIGGGRYVLESGGMGYDVCPEARNWLISNGRFGDPYTGPHVAIPAITCWDSLEHIPEPEKLLDRVSGWLFVSMPIYTGLADLLSSKHYKPGEHLHYWTFDGFVRWCAKQGFELMEVNHAETELGREGITSFAFKRVE
jgi:hypothetical protein